MRLGLNRHIRIRIFPAHTRPMWQNVNKVLVMCLVIISFSMGFTYYHTQINPLVVNIAKQRSSQIITFAINDVINDYMARAELDYEDLTVVQRGENGQIQALFMNTKTMNKVKAQLALELQANLEKIEQAQIKIPIGAMVDIPLLSGVGPIMNVDLIPIGYAMVDFENSFSSAGINQTKHQIDVVIDASFGMILSAGDENINVKNTIPIAQTIIIGEVPNGIFKTENLK